MRGEFLIRGSWESQAEAIIDVRLGGPDCNTHKKEPMGTLLAQREKEKKDKHGKHCHKERKYFSPFALSVDGMLGKEALVLLVNLSRLVAAKMEEPISYMRGWVNGRITIAVTISYSRMIRGARLPIPLGTGSRTGNRVWVWDWRNKSRARIVSCTPAQNSFVSCPTSHFPPFLDRAMRARLHMDDRQRQPPEAQTRAMMAKKRRRKGIGVKSWEFGVKSRDLSGNGRTKETKLYYKSVALSHSVEHYV